VLIIIGYISGITHKIISSRDIVILLYLVNLSMIIADLGLCLRYSIKEQGQFTHLSKWERVLSLFLPGLNRERVIPQHPAKFVTATIASTKLTLHQDL
jgi:hypothetical protein